MKPVIPSDGEKCWLERSSGDKKESLRSTRFSGEDLLKAKSQLRLLKLKLMDKSLVSHK